MLMLIFCIILVFLILYRIYALFTFTQCKSNACLIHKTALVTGGNSGIGYQVVLALASRGCRVIIADVVLDADLQERIYRETNNKNIVLKHVDLGSFKSVRDLAKDIINSEERLDILLNNAGIGRTQRITSQDGLDLTMQVNYFSPFLLTHLLVDLLKKSSGRVIFTSSYTSILSNLNVQKLTSSEGPFNSGYPDSKLGLIIIADMFAQKLKRYGVTSNSYHPGIVYTDIFSKERRISKDFDSTFVFLVLLELLAFIIGKTPQQGAQTAIYLCCAKEVENVTGKFFGEMAPTLRPNRRTYDKQLCQDIWDATERLVKLETHEKI